jgi:hypothetical protein
VKDESDVDKAGFIPEPSETGWEAPLITTITVMEAEVPASPILGPDGRRLVSQKQRIGFLNN